MGRECIAPRAKCFCGKWGYGSRACCFFFFQAEDGIRDVAVTGVQTCALPISIAPAFRATLAAARAHGARKPQRRALGFAVAGIIVASVAVAVLAIRHRLPNDLDRKSVV